MPKHIKGTAGRVPPEPTATPEQIQTWLADVMPRIRPLVGALDEAIRSTIPGLQCGIKWGRLFYGLPDLGWLIELAPYHRTANVVFYGGADFDPPPPLGSVDRTRYVKLATLDDAVREDVLDWIEQAGRTPGWS